MKELSLPMGTKIKFKVPISSKSYPGFDHIFSAEIKDKMGSKYYVILDDETIKKYPSVDSVWLVIPRDIVGNNNNQDKYDAYDRAMKGI